MPYPQSFVGVYFIHCPANNLVKIGFSTRDPDVRLETLRRASPEPLEPLGVIPGPMALESAIHRHFARLRHHNEWFAPDRNMVEFLNHGIDPWPSLPADPDRSRWMPPWILDLRMALETEAGRQDLGIIPWRNGRDAIPTRRHLKR